jgi:hypothetical protein
VPTVADRIAQTVVASRLVPRTEEIFHENSYGYRAGKSAIDAVTQCRIRCWKYNWVVDLDIRKFFDSVPRDLILKAVEANTEHRWILLYVQRWLDAPLAYPDGSLERRDPDLRKCLWITPAELGFLHVDKLWKVVNLCAIR